MGVSDFKIKDLAHKVRSIMAELKPPSSESPVPTGLSSAEQLPYYDFATEMDRDVTESGATPPESDVLRSGRSKAAQLAGRRLFTSPTPLRCSTGRCIAQEEDDESDKQYFTPIGENRMPEFSDSDSTSMSESPTRDDTITPKSESMLFHGEYFSDLDFDFNKIWLPPGPEDETDKDWGLFDDTEDRYEVGFDSDSSFVSDEFIMETTEVVQETSSSKIHTHFRALVSHLLNGEGFSLENKNYESYEGWLEIVASLAWQAANFVKPDTKKCGSMDPGYYVKVKCIASGEPSDSKFIKGVVCSKNVKHKRMVSRHVNPRILLLGGSLEYQRVSSKLASLNNVLQQEKDHLRAIAEQILAMRPHVLVVEKSVSPYAQEILGNEISLVLNVKKPLIERISRCTGAQIISSVDSIGRAKLGRCRAFYVEKVEQHLSEKCPKSKNLMFFEGCPRRHGCTVILRGTCLEELKKIKRVVQLAVFAAYHLSLESSFLADEGSSIPQFPSNSSNNEVIIDDLVFPFSDQNKQLHRSNEGNASSKITHNDSKIDNSQTILVSMSSRCVTKGIVCERARLFRIKFYGSSDKPLGLYLCDDLFNEGLFCQTCKEPSQAHVRYYRHQQGCVMISVRRLRDIRLPGEQDGRIWMWHQCLRCDPMESFAPVTRRVVMSKAAWGLSFGKFLELSFSNHTTANRVAPCGHSLPRDCLRFYGCGSFVAIFQYSPVDILSVGLPPPVLDLTCDVPQECIRREAEVIYGKIERLHAEVSDILCRLENCGTFVKDEPLAIGSKRDIVKLKDVLKMERNTYDVLLQPFLAENCQPFWSTVNFMELNRLKRSLLIDAYNWDHWLFQIDMDIRAQGSRLKSMPCFTGTTSFKIPRKPLLSWELDASSPRILEFKNTESIAEIDLRRHLREDYREPIYESEESCSCTSLSDQIDSAWTGSNGTESKTNFGSHVRKCIAPVRVHSFSSFLGLRQRVFGGPTSEPLNSVPVKSVDTFGDFPSMKRALSHKTPGEVENSNILVTHSPFYITSLSNLRADSARLLLPQGWFSDVMIAVYDDEPSSIISYALTLVPVEAGETHVKVSFEDVNALPDDKAKFSVTCYFAKQFEMLRGKCCKAELDFVRSLSRCKRWIATGGKSNVYFAKTLDERFVVKQVTKTELDSFEEFAPEYFNYVNRSFMSGSPTCLARILGIYQVSAKNMRGGRELKMDLMVMENLFFKRNISRIYDLKGSLRFRYNSDASGENKVLWDENLIEDLKKKPVFLGSNAKRQLERAVWNDTSFLASVDVMDYSLLVGIDDEHKELVVGIIDFMRQYTWDKQIETLVKASGILGGPKNRSPTIISPVQYKKRFRKAISQYFVAMPECWCS